MEVNVDYTDRTASIVKAAARVALEESREVNAGDLLLAILDEGQTPAVQALCNLGFDCKKLKFAIDEQFARVYTTYKRRYRSGD